jgi:hypothetical protein
LFASYGSQIRLKSPLWLCNALTSYIQRERWAT